MSRDALHTFTFVGSPVAEDTTAGGGAGGGAGPTTTLRRPSSMLALSSFMGAKDPPMTPLDKASSGVDSNNARASPIPMLTEEEILRQKGIDYLKMMAQRDEVQSRRTPQELMMSQKARSGSASLGPLSGAVASSYTNLPNLNGSGLHDKGKHTNEPQPSFNRLILSYH